MQAAPSKHFHSLREWNDDFLALWPHRYDYIYADHPDPGQRPEWKTESRHPLTDRLIKQGSYLYGVRFGPSTNYCLLDIDAGSPYHPRRDPLAIGRILSALEPLGLVSYLACTSSYSGGIHLYLPFQSAQKSWQLALAVQTLIENAGFKVALGQLEILPNPKVYSAEAPSVYAAHRLPMQGGSYLLNSNWEPIFSNPDTFVHHWQQVQAHNDIDEQTLELILLQARRRQYRISGKAEKFLNDLNAEINLGWTGDGQTNYLLGRIAMRSYIFGHLLTSTFPLRGQALVDDIIGTAKSLPGYSDYCGHQHEIEKRAEEWARCIENSHYYPYGSPKKPVVEQDLAPTWNQQQSLGARERIKTAIAQMLNEGTLPAGARSRFIALTSYGIGGGTLYRHRDLWHPEHLWKTSPDAENQNRPSALNGPNGLKGYTSLLGPDDGNTSTGVPFEVIEAVHREQPGNNSKPGEAFEQLKLDLQQRLTQIKAQIEQQKQATRTQRSLQAHEASRVAMADRMKRYLESGDPILIAEARRWMAYLKPSTPED